MRQHMHMNAWKSVVHVAESMQAKSPYYVQSCMTPSVLKVRGSLGFTPMQAVQSTLKPQLCCIGAKKTTCRQGRALV